MRIAPATNVKLSFQREFSNDEMNNYKKIVPEALDKIGAQDKFVLIVHDICLPQESSKDVGVGNITSNIAQNFFKKMKDYLHINCVELLPQGDESYNFSKKTSIPYKNSSLSLGKHVIDAELLTSDEFGKILTKSEFNDIVKANKAEDKDKIANIENVIFDDSPFDKALRKAYNRFKSSNLQNTSKFKEDFEKYKAENNDWLEPKGIYLQLAKEKNESNWKKWGEDLDKNLYTDKYPQNQIIARKNEILTNGKDDIDFYKFKQFLAEQHLKIGKNGLNQKGLKLIGDCQINFSPDEIWAHQDAFYLNGSVGWGIKALKYPEVVDESSEASKLFKKKVQMFAKRYDGIRFDVGWLYFNTKTKINGVVEHKDMGDSIVKVIEKEVQDTKGKDYDLKNLMYECDCDFSDFSVYSGYKLKSETENRTKIFTSAYMSKGWGSSKAFVDRGFNPDYFVVGENHDNFPIRPFAEGFSELNSDFDRKIEAERKSAQIEALAENLKISKASLENPITFMQAKFADLLTAKNKMAFYMNIFGRKERFNAHNTNGRENFRYRIPENFSKAYHEAVEGGFGFNLPDAIEKVFKARGLDKLEPELFSKILNFKNILNEPAKAAIKKNSKSDKIVFGITAMLSAISGTIYLNDRTLKHSKNGSKCEVSTIQQKGKIENLVKA